MTKFMPVFLRENLRYFREEKEGYWTFISRIHPEAKELICNPTAYQILEQCDGVKCVSEIYHYFETEYPKVDKGRIRMDINKTLVSFSRLGIVDWNEANPFENKMEENLGEGFSGSVGYEEDLPVIMEFLNIHGIPRGEPAVPGNFIFHFNPLLPSKYYHEVSVRQRIFGYVEEFFLLKEEETLAGLMAVGLNINNNPNMATNVGTFNLIVLNREHDILDEILNYVLRTLPLISIKEPTKVKYLELEDRRKNRDQREVSLLLEKNGFTFEGLLRNETGFNKNIGVFAYYYSTNFMKSIKHTLKEGIQSANKFF